MECIWRLHPRGEHECPTSTFAQPQKLDKLDLPKEKSKSLLLTSGHLVRLLVLLGHLYTLLWNHGRTAVENI
jgi:hypothetical protein